MSARGFSVANPGASGPYFKGAITAATAIPATASLHFPAVEDTHSGYNSETFTYTVPRAGVYLITVALQFNGSAPVAGSSINIFRNGTQRFNGRVCPAVNFGGPEATWLTRFAAGDTINVQSSAAFTTVAAPGGTENSYWIVQWVRA